MSQGNLAVESTHLTIIHTAPGEEERVLALERNKGSVLPVFMISSIILTRLLILSETQLITYKMIKIIPTCWSS